MSNRRKLKSLPGATMTIMDKGAGQRALFGFERGVYLWKFPNGKFFVNENGDPLNVPAIKGDVRAMAEITAAARHYGEPDGTPYFMAGVSRVTDEEAEVQLERLKAGLIPSENDLGAWVDAQRDYNKFGDEINE